MTVYIDLKNELTPCTRKSLEKNYLGPVPPAKEEQTDSGKEAIDELIVKNGFITPAQYYATQMDGTHGSTDKSKQGYYNSTGGNANLSVTWFWCEDIKNWCSYAVYSNTLGNNINLFLLQVWNGKDGWIAIPNLCLSDADATAKANDRYNIGEIQEYFLSKARNGFSSEIDNVNAVDRNVIIQQRGIQQDPTYTADNSRVNIVSRPWHRLQTIVGLRLQKTTKYSINDTNNFQTIRWNSVYAPVTHDRLNNIGNFAQGNFRNPITIGVPPVWRLPTGEICLASTLYYNSDGGNGYIYAKVAEGAPFIKVPLGITRTSNFWVSCNNILGDNDLEAAAWVNSICANFFGNGNDKTIERDWLHETKMSENDTSEYDVSYDDMLDSSKAFEQHNINKENSLKCSFTVNRPVVTTEEITGSDYAKKW